MNWTGPPPGSPPGHSGAGSRPGAGAHRDRPRPSRLEVAAPRPASRTPAVVGARPGGRGGSRGRSPRAGSKRGRGSGGRATYIRSRRIRCGALRLGEDRAERSDGAGVGLAGQEQLRPADDHGQGVVQLVTRPGGELGQGVELASLQPQTPRMRPGRDGPDGLVEPPAEPVPLGDQDGPGLPGAGRRVDSRPRTRSLGIGPEVDLGTRLAPIPERHDHAGGPFVARRGSPSASGAPGLGAGTGPDDPGGGDARLTAPGKGRPFGPGLGTVRRVRCDQTRPGSDRAPARPPGARTHRRRSRACRAGQPLLVRRGVGLDEGRAATDLDLGDQEPDPRVGGRRVTQVPRERSVPRGSAPPRRTPPGSAPAASGRRRSRSRRRSAVGVEPGGIDDERVAPPALGQVRPSVGRLDSQLRRSTPGAAADRRSASQSDEPFGIDGGDRPASQAVQEARRGRPLGLGVVRLARQPARGAG